MTFQTKKSIQNEIIVQSGLISEDTIITIGDQYIKSISIVNNESRIIREIYANQKIFFNRESKEILIVENPETYSLIKL